jgi:hypothetical protein
VTCFEASSSPTTTPAKHSALLSCSWFRAATEPFMVRCCFFCLGYSSSHNHGPVFGLHVNTITLAVLPSSSHVCQVDNLAVKHYSRSSSFNRVPASEKFSTCVHPWCIAYGWHPGSVAAVQVTVLSAPVSLYPLHRTQGWVHLLSDLFFLCTAAVHVYFSIRPALRYLWTVLHHVKVRLHGIAPQA